MKVISYINWHKALVPPVVVALMWYFDNWTTEAFLYLSLHGTYSVLWLTKESLYPDRRFQDPQPLWIGGDAQKYYTLRLRPGLIDDGLFARTRNPNYLGEILIYTAFAGLSWHWLPFVVLGAWVFGFFLRNMLAKDKSLARHPGFAAYKARSGLLLPRFW
jgi:Protein of unknown function (DUF1295)